jgi:hypothetical protein
VECAELLCRKQPWSVNMRDGTGRTALHWAAVRSEGDTMKAILNFGAKPLIRDNEVCSWKIPCYWARSVWASNVRGSMR